MCVCVAVEFEIMKRWKTEEKIHSDKASLPSHSEVRHNMKHALGTGSDIAHIAINSLMQSGSFVASFRVWPTAKITHHHLYISDT